MTSEPLTRALQETLTHFDDSGEPQTTTEVADRLDLGRRSTYERLERLANQDRLRTKKVGSGGRVWWRPPTGTGDGQSTSATGQEYTQNGSEGRARSELTQQVLETAPASIFVLDRSGDIVLVNERFRERLGPGRSSHQLSVDDIVLYDTSGEPIPPEGRPYATVFRTGTAVSGWECQVELNSGNRRWVTLNAAPLTDEDGSVDRVVVSVEDTTRQRSRTERLERQRDDLERELNEIFQRIDDGVVAMDEAGRVTYLNGRAEALFDVHSGECVGSHLTDAVPELGETVFEAKLDQTLRSQESTTFETFLEGIGAWLELTIYPSETGVSVYVRDISDRKERERTLERYRAIVETMNDGVYTVSADGEFTFANDQYAEQMGLDTEQLVGRSVSEVVDEELAAQAKRLEGELVEGERDVAKLQATFGAEDGETQTMEATFALMWRDDEIYERVAVVRDITDHVSRKRALEESNRQLETLVENFPNGAVALVDTDMRYVTAGGTPLEDAGVTTEELVGERIEDVFPDRIVEFLAPRYRAAIEGRAQSFEREHDGEVRQFHVVPVEDTDGTVLGAIGMSQDVSEQKRYERSLERRIRQLESISDLGTLALQDRDLDVLMAEVVELVSSVLDVDYCKVLDLEQDADELLLRQGVGWDEGIAGSATVSAVEDDSQAAYTLAVDHPVVVEDLDSEARFSGPDLLRDHDVRSGISVIIGPYDDPWGILGTHDTETREFSDQDINFVQSVANILANAIERASAERELVTQREQLAALNGLNSIVHGITDAVIDQSTREQIERTACEHLVETGSYSGAWIGESTDVSAPDAVRTGAGPATPLTDGSGGDSASTDGVTIPETRSSISIPISHEGMRYGVLHVHSDRANAFERDEAAVLGRLGEVVGHAIAASERKQALMSDDVVEVHYRVEDVLEPFDVPDAGGRITFDQALHVGEDEFLVFGSATTAAVETIDALVEAVPHWTGVTFRDDDDVTKFEISLTEPPVVSVLASMGGSIQSAVIEGGSFDLTVHVSPGTDIRDLTETVRESHPGARLVSRRQRRRPDETFGVIQEALETNLTDRQRLVVQSAYHAGYFDWPREANGEEIADSLGISSPTFHQHLRKVESRLFEALLSNSPVST